ncbi:MAG: hypothetical protein ACRDZZ_06865 [Ilumatobacteraceae bacterium]
MASSPQSFQKRQRELARQERAAAKRARRHSRDSGEAESETGGLSEDELLEQFRLLNERREAGKVSAEDFEARRTEIFAQLGLGEG